MAGWVKFCIQTTYFGVVFGFIFPLGLGLLMEIFVIAPLKSLLYGDNGVFFAFIGYRILLEFPNHRITINVNRVFHGRRFSQWDIERATKYIVWPTFKSAFLALAIPAAAAHLISYGLDLGGESRTRLFRWAYPGTMLLWMMVAGMRQSVDIMQEWSQYVREQEYLVGRMLHNLTEEEIDNAIVEGEEQQPQPQPQQQQPAPAAAPSQQQQQQSQQQQQQEQQPTDVQSDYSLGQESSHSSKGKAKSTAEYEFYYDEDEDLLILEGEGEGGYDDNRLESSSIGRNSSGSSPRVGGAGAGAGSGLKEHRNQYGLRSSEGDCYGHAREGEYEEDAEGAVAGRTRSRRSPRLQSIRGSHEER
ncbi:hypothetical protein BGZ65_008489 [Modicella reniformis]|uniref:RING-type E3 ubiquitin transferase n=1 Tax=Modicella reniformis TaxID=1440133 RepID=A0A9P6MET1_9FUNG|nr:hypothetical protein BGZ65_008489 [Modicella reniformis]